MRIKTRVIYKAVDEQFKMRFHLEGFDSWALFSVDRCNDLVGYLLKDMIDVGSSSGSGNTVDKGYLKELSFRNAGQDLPSTIPGGTFKQRLSWIFQVQTCVLFKVGNLHKFTIEVDFDLEYASQVIDSFVEQSRHIWCELGHPKTLKVRSEDNLRVIGSIVALYFRRIHFRHVAVP